MQSGHNDPGSGLAQAAVPAAEMRSAIAFAMASRGGHFVPAFWGTFSALILDSVALEAGSLCSFAGGHPFALRPPSQGSSSHMIDNVVSITRRRRKPSSAVQRTLPDLPVNDDLSERLDRIKGHISRISELMAELRRVVEADSVASKDSEPRQAAAHQQK